MTQLLNPAPVEGQPDWVRIRQGLLAPFPRESIEFLPKNVTGERALGLPYLDARDVMQRLDQVVTPPYWSFDYEILSEKPMRVKGKLVVHGVLKADAGEANGEDEQLKSAVSDAIKRCGVHWGIGRYLYALNAKNWFDYDPHKRRWKQTPALDPVDEARALRSVGYLPNPEAPVGNISVASPLPDQCRREGVSVPQRGGGDPPGGNCCSQCSAPMNAGQVAFSQRNHEQLTCPKCASGRTSGPARVAPGPRRF